MLILTRHPQDEILLHLPGGETIRVVYLNRSGNAVRIGIDAPQSIVIMRSEISVNPEVDRKCHLRSP